MRIHRGDITLLEVDAIVTPANESLCGGGGVDGAVHRAAGPALLEECRTLGICNPGEAKITDGYLLRSKYLIHTVGPVWEGGQYDEENTLQSCYKNCLQLAQEYGIESLAFPCIATGVYSFPKDRACDLAVTTVSSWLRMNEMPKEVIFCCFEKDDEDLYRKKLESC